MINILSIFDGISCGQIAFSKLKLPYTYYSSEIDKSSIGVTQLNFPKTIQLGDVTKISLDDIPKVDILLGGSPCQGFSYNGKKLNFDDPRSKLFFQYVKIKNTLKPKYFLLENVNMNPVYSSIISSFLGVEPLVIDSAYFSAQTRKRLYWTNIPINSLKNKYESIFIKDIITSSPHTEVDYSDCLYSRYGKNYFQWYYRQGIDSQHNRAYYTSGKCGTLNTNCYAKFFTPEGIVYNFTIEELETLQTIPVNYTHGFSVSARKKMIGNGWTVAVIDYIFQNLPKIL